MNGKFVFGVFLTLLIVASVIGVGMYAYNLGIAQGMLTSGKLDAPAAGTMLYPYYRPFGYHPFGGLLSCLVPLFVLCVLFSVVRMVFWRGRWGGMHRRHWDKESIPPMVEEWHRKMHEQQPAPKV